MCFSHCFVWLFGLPALRLILSYNNLAPPSTPIFSLSANNSCLKLTPTQPTNICSGLAMAVSAGQHIRSHLLQHYDTHEAGFVAPRIIVYVSPFLRTRQTLRGVIKGLGEKADWIKSVRETPLLVEQDWGLFEGSGIRGAAAKYPDEWDRCQRLKAHQVGKPFEKGV
jgi:hypothetical protein